METSAQTWQCTHCGDTVEIARDVTPAALIVGAGTERVYQVLLVSGVERHRCELRVDEVALPPLV